MKKLLTVICLFLVVGSSAQRNVLFTTDASKRLIIIRLLTLQSLMVSPIWFLQQFQQQQV
jgi:hypothetical protein